MCSVGAGDRDHSIRPSRENSYGTTSKVSKLLACVLHMSSGKYGLSLFLRMRRLLFRGWKNVSRFFLLKIRVYVDWMRLIACDIYKANVLVLLTFSEKDLKVYKIDKVHLWANIIIRSRLISHLYEGYFYTFQHQCGTAYYEFCIYLWRLLYR